VLKWCAGLFALASGIRIAYILLVPQKEPLLLDQAAYDALAEDILAGRPYILEQGEGYESPVAPPLLWDPSSPTGVYPPGYPVFIAGVYLLLGHSHTAVRLAQALLWGIATVILFLLGTSAGLGRLISGLGAAVLALSPPHVELSALLLSENIFTPLVFLATLFLILSMSKNPWWAAASGACAGLAGLARPTGAGLALALALILILALRSRGIGPAIALVLIAALALLPWAVRNQRAFGKPIFTSTAGGKALYLTATGIPEYEDWDSIQAFLSRKGVEPSLLYQALDESQLDSIYMEMAKEAFKRNPTKAIPTLALNPLRFAFNMPYPGTRPSARTIAYAIFTAIVLALSAWGLAKRGNPRLWAMALVFAYFMLAHTVMSPALVRYSLPAVPLLYPIALSAFSRDHEKAVPQGNPPP